ncbi:hypothetical protein [Nocardia wallacei]|uniref:hypothetical protein n=1 Tax=Nocardia wallacei TaxID=480035 RepID=UPI0024570B97|nr:hypothetical protein [Nocardia wallacei]
MTVTWADVSQYQGIPVDDLYPHPVFAFRTNTGDREDTLAAENARRALDMLNRGQLQLVIAYYFFWPGEANCDLHREVLERAGLWRHPSLVSMADVEGAPAGNPPVKRVRGDQSDEMNDEITRLASWYGDRRRVVGYWNPVADPELWPRRPEWLRLVVPSYGRPPGEPKQKPPGYFAHQYTETGRCAPWGGRNVDLNHTDLELPELLAQLGITGGTPVSDPIAVGAGQLLPTENRLRQINHPENVNPSTRSPKEPWPYDMWSDTWNEVVHDGYDFAREMADVPDDEKRSLVGMVRTIGARQSRLREQLDRIEAKLDQLGGEAK